MTIIYSPKYFHSPKHVTAVYIVILLISCHLCLARFPGLDTQGFNVIHISCVTSLLQSIKCDLQLDLYGQFVIAVTNPLECFSFPPLYTLSASDVYLKHSEMRRYHF